MIDTTGPFILLIMLLHPNSGGLTSQEMKSFEACKAAQIQLEVLGFLDTACIAKDIIDD